MAAWADLVAENRASVMGAEMYAEIRAVAAAIARRYPPSVYATSADWDESALDDLAQDVAKSLCAEEHGEPHAQLSYIMRVSDTTSDFRGLVGRRVRRVLSAGRPRTVIDNLLDRVRPLLGQPPFLHVGKIDGRNAFALVSDAELRAATQEELKLAALAVSKIPKLPPPAGDRAPMVYRQPDLVRVLETIAEVLPCAFTEREVALVLEQVLTGWVPILLGEDVEIESVEDHEWSESDLSQAESVAGQVLAQMDPVQKRALTLWQRNMTHAQIAEALGCSRPTAAKRIDEGVQYLREAFAELSLPVQKLAVDAVSIGLDREET